MTQINRSFYGATYSRPNNYGTTNVAAPMQHMASDPLNDKAREANAKKALDQHLNDSFNEYYKGLTDDQKKGFVPKTSINPSLVINGSHPPDEDHRPASPGIMAPLKGSVEDAAQNQAIAESITKMNARQYFMQGVKGKQAVPTAAGLMAPASGPTESGAALGAPGLPPVSDDIRKAYSEKEQDYLDAKNYRENGANRGIPFEAYLGTVQHNRQFKKDEAQKLVDKQVKDQQAADKAKADNALKDAQTQRALTQSKLDEANAKKALTPNTSAVDSARIRAEAEAAHERFLKELNDTRLDSNAKTTLIKIERDMRQEKLKDEYGKETPRWTDQQIADQVAKYKAAFVNGHPPSTQPGPATQTAPATQPSNVAQGTPATSTQPFRPSPATQPGGVHETATRPTTQPAAPPSQVPQRYVDPNPAANNTAQLPQGSVLNPDGTMTYNGVVYRKKQ